MMTLTSTQIGQLAAQFFLAGAGTLSFAVLFACPKRTLPCCALVGAVGWFVYELAVMLGADSAAASLLAVIPLTLLTRVFAIVLKMPVTVFLLSGIFPLVPGAGIGEINAVEKDHGLVERASPDEDVGLHALAPAFADIDRRCEAQGGLQGLDGRCGLCFPVEKRGVRLGVARGSRLTPGDADFPYPQCLEDSGRVGSLRGRTLRRKQQDRHPDREDPDSHITVEAGKNRPVFATPTLEAGVLLCLDVFHLFEIWVKSEKTSEPGPAALASGSAPQR